MDIYFTLFKLILEGKLGHGSELVAAREAKAHAKHRKPGKKGAPEHARSKPSGGAPKRAPSSADQVTTCVHFDGSSHWLQSVASHCVSDRHIPCMFLPIVCLRNEDDCDYGNLHMLPCSKPGIYFQISVST